MQKINMLGTKHGSLLVIEEIPKEASHFDILWKCRCDCGKECVIPGKTLRKPFQHTCPDCRKINDEGEFQYVPYTYKDDPNIIERHSDYFLYECRQGSGGRFLVDRKFYEKIRKYNWSMDKKGNVFYLRNIERKKYRTPLSHFLLDITDKKTIVKHLNGNPRDYRFHNLHKCPLGKTTMGATVPKNHSTGFKGVRLNNRSGMYMANIYPNGQEIRLGTFKTAQEAADAYDEAAIHYYGVMALTNAEIKRRRLEEENESRKETEKITTDDDKDKVETDNSTGTENDEKYMFYWCRGGKFLTDRKFKDKLAKHKWLMDKNGNVTMNIDTNTVKWSNTFNLAHYLLDLPDDNTVAVMHFNGVTSDYREENLLVGRKGDIIRRGGLRSTNTSGYKGVLINKKYGYIHASIRINGKHKHLGTFDTIEKAAAAYDEAAIKYYGSAALTNAEIQRRKNKANNSNNGTAAEGL